MKTEVLKNSGLIRLELYSIFEYSKFLGLLELLERLEVLKDCTKSVLISSRDVQIVLYCLICTR